ncbi:epoxide hydrolase family protein [Mycetocola zhadangensis]|uniref:Epoxide hydrolase n=1 Tax=Mycetocola zhadangensis TaxID=1164595 RepID=A0A3L7J6T9_9MICO|nr:epoxide hydrolase [Mycetocola zhadangensis]RLQ84212.1 epoxide hydrolase [Mycetocola zhadangensis]GGE95100.1 multidrug MFS transporter [Mycetocola zhadangensis]
MDIRPFTIEVPQLELDDLRERLDRTRWPNETTPTGWLRGTELAYLQELTEHWRTGYDWSAAQANLNRFDHYLAEVQGLDIHFIHQRSGRANAVPIVLLHGWADSFYRYIHLIDRLTGGDGPTFDVIVPSLPGFDFSDQRPAGTGEQDAVFAAEVVAELLEGLGYDRYLVHGGDWGSSIGQEIARAHPDRVIGLHLTDVPFANMYLLDPTDTTDAEKAFVAAVETWSESFAGYVMIQTTRPLTLSYALSDSPVGLAAWLIDHFERYSTTRLPHDDLLTNVMLYWLRNSIRSSIRYYNEGMGDWSATEESWGDAALDDQTTDASPNEQDWSADTGGWAMKIDVPTAIAVFPDDITDPPREYAERFFDIRRFTKMERGGHFAALEVPALVAEDIRAFVAELDK